MNRQEDHNTFDVEADAVAHYNEVMGSDLPIEERRRLARVLVEGIQKEQQ